MNDLPQDIKVTIKGLELLIAFRESYQSWDSPAIVLSWFNTKTTEWVPVYAYPCDGYNNPNNPKMHEHQAWIITDFANKVNDLIWDEKLPFPGASAGTDEERFAEFLRRVLIINDTGLSINKPELDKRW